MKLTLLYWFCRTNALYRNFTFLNFNWRRTRIPCGQCNVLRNRKESIIWSHHTQILLDYFSIRSNSKSIRLPSSSNVARVNLFNLLLKHDSGIPLRETVVNGTRQSVLNKYWIRKVIQNFYSYSIHDKIINHCLILELLTVCFCRWSVIKHSISSILSSKSHIHTYIFIGAWRCMIHCLK